MDRKNRDTVASGGNCRLVVWRCSRLMLLQVEYQYVLVLSSL